MPSTAQPYNFCNDLLDANASHLAIVLLRRLMACCAALDAAGVPAAPVQTMDKVLADPQTLARAMVVEQDHPVLGRRRRPLSGGAACGPIPAR